MLVMLLLSSFLAFAQDHPELPQVQKNEEAKEGPRQEEEKIFDRSKQEKFLSKDLKQAELILNVPDNKKSKR